MNDLFNNVINKAINNAPANVMTDEVFTDAQLVDRLAYVKSAVAALKEEEGAIKGLLIERNQRVYESDFYRCTVAGIEGGTKTDWQALALSMKPSKQRIVAHTVPTAPYFRIDVRAKKTS